MIVTAKLPGLDTPQRRHVESIQDDSDSRRHLRPSVEIGTHRRRGFVIGNRYLTIRTTSWKAWSVYSNSDNADKSRSISVMVL